MKRILGACLAVLGTASCGTEEIHQWVVATINQQVTVGPNAKCDQVQDKVTETLSNQDQLVTIYQGDPNKYYLDLGGGVVIEGTKTSGTYTFNSSSKTTTVNDTAHPLFQRVETQTISITLTPDGDQIKGSYQTEHKIDCTNMSSGDPCMAVLGGKVTDCLGKADLTGSALSDIEYKRSAGGLGSGTPGSGSL